MDMGKRVAVITGGASGIGRAVAAAMARRGIAAVALVDMSEAVEDVAAKLNAEAGRTVTICGKEMRVAAIDDRICRSCKNGARPNAYHPAGSPDRLGALCNRTCIDHLERAERIQGLFAAPFRKRPAWQVDASGRSSLQDGE